MFCYSWYEIFLILLLQEELVTELSGNVLGDEGPSTRETMSECRV